MFLPCTHCRNDLTGYLPHCQPAAKMLAAGENHTPGYLAPVLQYLDWLAAYQSSDQPSCVLD